MELLLELQNGFSLNLSSNSSSYSTHIDEYFISQRLNDEITTKSIKKQKSRSLLRMKDCESK